MKNSKKLLAAVAALVVALAVSVGSTFAWFTTNSKVTVSNINASVTTGDSNLEVALVSVRGVAGLIGDFGYDLNLGKSYVDGGLKEIFENTKFDALTDNQKKTPEKVFTDEDFAWEATAWNGLGLVDKKGTPAKPATAKVKTTTTGGENNVPLETKYEIEEVAEGSYISFILRFRTPSSTAGAAGIPLYFAPGESFVTSGAGLTHSDLVAQDDTYKAAYDIDANKELTAKAEDAIRVGFYEANVKAPKDTASNDGEAGALHTDGEGAKIWIPHADEGWDLEKYTELNDEKNDRKVKKFSQFVEENLTGGDVDFTNLYATRPYDDYYLDGYDADNAISFVGDNKVEIAKMQLKDGYYVADLMINIWLEGTDADCLNTILADILNIKLTFTVDED